MTYAWKKGMTIDQQWESWQDHNPIDKIEAVDTDTLKEALIKDLSFVSKMASYNLKDYIIKADNVDEIYVADAIIYPPNGSVVVETDAKMRTFNDASILVNRNARYHELFDADVTIYGSKNYFWIYLVNNR